MLLWHFETGLRVDSSPAVADGVVFVGSFDKKVYALKAGGADDADAAVKEQEKVTNTAGEGDDVNVLPANLQRARETEHTATGSPEETE